MFNMQKVMNQAGKVCGKLRDAAQEAAPSAKQAVGAVANTANVFVAALKNKPEMVHTEEVK